MKSQFATSSSTGPGHGGRRKLPLAFTEHGAIQAATVLSSPRAVEVSVYVVRAFVQLRELSLSHRDLAKRLDALEEKTEALAMRHDSFSRNTRIQLKQVFDALRDLMTPPDPPKRPIGFVTHEDRGKKRMGLTRSSYLIGLQSLLRSTCTEFHQRGIDKRPTQTEEDCLRTR